MSNLIKGKNVFFLLAFHACIYQIHSQDILWEKSYGGKHAEYLYDVQPTDDYGFILAGSSLSDKNGNKEEKNKGDLDYWVWKMDEKGGLDWQKSFGGIGVDLLQSIRLTKDAGFILAGTSVSNKGLDKKEDGKGKEDFWIIKLNAKGGEMWQKTIGGNGQEKLQSIVQTSDGGYVLGGSSSSDRTRVDEKGVIDQYGKSENSRGNLDYWVVKLKENGTIEWQKTIGGKYIDELKSIEQTKDGGYILGGYSNSPISGEKSEGNFGIGDYWIVKLDKDGSIEWQKTIGGDKDDNLFVLTQTNDGGYIAGGNSNSGATNSKSKGNSDGTDFWVVKLDREGVIVWQETYNYGKVDILTSLIENKDGSFLIGGYAQSEINSTVPKSGVTAKLQKKSDKKGINDYIALKINDKGEEIWTQTIGSAGEDLLKKLVETRDGGYLLAGTSKGKVSRDKNSNIGSNDFWVVKLKDKTKSNKVKVSIEVSPNPTPAFTNVIVGYDFESGTATVVDLAGHVLQQFAITSRTVPIDLSAYPIGIYIVNIITNVQTDGVKVIKNVNKN